MANERKLSLLSQSKLLKIVPLFLLSYAKLSLSDESVTPVPLLCSIPDFDYFNLTAKAWSINLPPATCLQPKAPNISQSSEPCTVLIAFCHDLNEFGPCDDSSVCQKSKAANLSLGRYSQNPFILEEDTSVHRFHAKFRDGDMYTTTSNVSCLLRTNVTLTCDKRAHWPISTGSQSIEPAPDPYFISYNASTCEMNISFYYSGACRYTPRKGGHLLSAGGVVLLVFSTSFLLYIIIGSVINKAQGHVGTEIIPHYGFWTKLPTYIKDGCSFTFCCKRKPATSSYNAI